MPNYITHGLVYKKEQVGCVNEGHVALRYTPRFKTKALSAPVPGLITVH